MQKVRKELEPYWSDMREMVQALNPPDTRRESPTGEEEPDTEQLREDARQAIDERPLSVEVRSGLETDPAKFKPAEYNILLATGGPAVRIIGKLDQYNEPETAELQFQDWGTPWIGVYQSEEETSILLQFAQCFTFGE